MFLKSFLIFFIAFQLTWADSEFIEILAKAQLRISKMDELLKLRWYDLKELQYVNDLNRFYAMDFKYLTDVQMKMDVQMLSYNLSRIEANYPNLKSDCVMQKNYNYTTLKNNYYDDMWKLRTFVQDYVSKYMDLLKRFNERIEKISVDLNGLIVSCPVKYYLKIDDLKLCFDNGIEMERRFLDSFYNDLMKIKTDVWGFFGVVDDKFYKLVETYKMKREDLIEDYKYCLE